MAAYVVFTKVKTRDPAEMANYGKKAKAAGAGHRMTARVVYGRHEVLEGPPIEGMVIVEFPSMEEAKAWYNSPAYQDARKHRFAGADYTAVIVEGI